VPAMADAEDVLHGIRRATGVRYTGIFLNVQGLQRALAADCASFRVFSRRKKSRLGRCRRRRKRVS